MEKNESVAPRRTLNPAPANSAQKAASDAFFPFGTKILADYDGRTGTDYGIEIQNHAHKLSGGTNGSNCFIGIKGQSKSIDGAHQIHQKHFQKQGKKNLWESHRSLWRFYFAQIWIVKGFPHKVCRYSFQKIVTELDFSSSEETCTVTG